MVAGSVAEQIARAFHRKAATVIALRVGTRLGQKSWDQESDVDREVLIATVQELLDDGIIREGDRT